jgi:signal transduction histidine kinase
MRVVALIILLAAMGAQPVAAQSGPATKAAAQDPRYARFETAVAEAKTAMMGDPEQALLKSEQAIARAGELPPSNQAEIAMATAEWLKGESFMFLNQTDKAVPVVKSALARVERHAPGTKLQGDLMRSRGAIAAIKGNVVEAMADYQRAHDIFRAAHEARSQAIALQDIGQIYSEAGDYPRTLEYYSQAAELYDKEPAFRLTAHNNRAEVLRKLGRYGEAEADFREALKSARELKSPLLEVRILSNLAAAQVEGGKTSAAQRTIDEALRLSRSGEAAGWKPFVLGAAAQVATARHNLPLAASLLRQAFAGADFTTTPMPFREFHQLAAGVFEKLGDQPQALAHLKAFQRLDGEARNLTASTASQLMAARFDFQNQKQKIVERDARIKQQEAEFRSTVLGGLVIAGGIVFALLLASALRIRRSRNQVRAANVVLNETNTALEKALKAKTEFLATTSHEIRTPLNGILGMTQILLTNRKLDAEMREQVQVVHGAGESMRALVDDILDVAKMEKGDIAVASEEVQFRHILEDAARLWSGHAVAKGLALELDIASAPALIRSDGARLRQIVANLLSNAIKFTLEGSVLLESQVIGGDLLIEVRDTGIGIPEDHQKLVFEAFHQVDGGTTRQFSGTGLGLSICHSLAEALGGSITVESAVGEGSAFIVRLPAEIVAEPETITGAPGGGRPETLADARLLLVESNAMTQGVFRALLEPRVGSLDCVESGAAAIAAIRTGTTDHLLVEAQSAGIDGSAPLDSLKAVIEAALAAGIPVTLLVAPSEEFQLGDVASLGASQLVVKPVGGAQLIATLHEAYAAPAADLSSAA